MDPPSMTGCSPRVSPITERYVGCPDSQLPRLCIKYPDSPALSHRRWDKVLLQCMYIFILQWKAKFNISTNWFFCFSFVYLLPNSAKTLGENANFHLPRCLQLKLHSYWAFAWLFHTAVGCECLDLECPAPRALISEFTCSISPPNLDKTFAKILRPDHSIWIVDV